MRPDLIIEEGIPLQGDLDSLRILLSSLFLLPLYVACSSLRLNFDGQAAVLCVRLRHPGSAERLTTFTGRHDGHGAETRDFVGHTIAKSDGGSSHGAKAGVAIRIRTR